MNAEHVSVLEQLDVALFNRSSSQRAAALRGITDLFVASAHSLDDDTGSLFDDIMGRLLEVIETSARAELSQRLAHLPNAPIRSLHKLAGDQDVAVAEPVLRHSTQLSDDVLVEIASSRGQGHLLAISARSSLGEQVTDVLVNRGDSQVVKNVLANPRASISERGYGLVVDRADQDSMIAELLSKRRDIPPHVFCSMLARASTAVRQQLIAEAPDGMRGEIGHVIGNISDKIAAGAMAEERDYPGALRRLLLESAGRSINEADVFKYAQEKRTEETIAGLSLCSELPVDLVAKLVHGEDVKLTLLVCKAAHFHWPTVRAVVLLRAGRRSQSLDDLERLCSEFGKLSESTARAILNFRST